MIREKHNFSLNLIPLTLYNKENFGGIGDKRPMVRVSKKDRKKRCPRKPRYGFSKTGPLKDQLDQGYKTHQNAYQAKSDSLTFISMVK